MVELEGITQGDNTSTMKFVSLNLLFLSTCIKHVNGWDIPPANFIHEFATHHQLTSATFYLPTENAIPWLTWHKKHFSK